MIAGAIGVYDYPLDTADISFPHMHLTGLDPEVAGTLDRDSNTKRFLQAAWTMVELDIMKGLKRDFSIMTVNFGCTAGQHRSVYLAERLAGIIKNEFPEVEIELVHLERSHWPC
ncbi:MAG: RNase adapter RapZ [Candidatus Taylorbacteria bacterium]|nr:RNase adapter RapZ [Candidatus Taylorbacteria bacterium]